MLVEAFYAKVKETSPLFLTVPLRPVPALKRNLIVRLAVHSTFINFAERRVVLSAKFRDNLLARNRKTKASARRRDGRFAGEDVCSSVDILKNELENDSIVSNPVDSALLMLGLWLADERTFGFDSIRALKTVVLPVEEVQRANQGVSRFAAAKRFSEDFERVVDNAASACIFTHPEPTGLESSFKSIFKYDFLRIRQRRADGRDKQQRNGK